jgi:hypothetical protein
MNSILKQGVTYLALLFTSAAVAQNDGPPVWDKNSQTYTEYTREYSAYTAKIASKNAKQACSKAPKTLQVGMSVTHMKCIMGKPANTRTSTSSSGKTQYFRYGQTSVISQNGTVTQWSTTE